MIVQLVLSTPVEGVSFEEMRAAALAAESAFRQIPGRLHHHLLVTADQRLWVDLLYWQNSESAEKAHSYIEHLPEVQALFSKSDPTKSEVWSLETVLGERGAAGHVTELALFRTAAGVSEVQMRQAAAQTWKVLAGQSGYVGRELLRDEQGQWVDVVQWESMEQALQAMQMMEQNSAMLPFLQAIDPAAVRMFHLTPVHVFA